MSSARHELARAREQSDQVDGEGDRTVLGDELAKEPWFGLVH